MIIKLHDLFKPENYKLKLDVDVATDQFYGVVSIQGNTTSRSNLIKLHAKELKITEAQIDDKKVIATLDESEDLLILSSKGVVDEGKHTVTVKFQAPITDAMHGLYPCYFEHEGKTKKLIATQFESHHAREVFPCVDEPAAKATFDLELISPKGETVLSNTPIRSQKETGNKLTTSFETTPVMSTYLLAFVFGEMVSKKAYTKDGVLVQSWASVAQDPSWLEFSLDEAVKYIEFYNDYFETPYPLSKCDQVALPDFESGAMENWGLITYRETAMLSDPKNVSLSTQQLVAIVVAHELSHQWFGNLVTMEWWDDLWLNESFASMMEYIAVDFVHPEWQIWEQYVSQDVITATNRDVYSDVQPVRVDVQNPSEIHTLFDPAIVYAKGGKLLKGLLDMIGEEQWRKGLKLYFKKHAYGNTTRDDLWNALSVGSKLDVSSFMEQWLEHAGQPLVTVSQQKETVKLSQHRLLLDGSEDSSVWQIPLLSQSLPVVFDSNSETIELNQPQYVQLNSTGMGHYIVNYKDPDHKIWLAGLLADEDQPSTWKIVRLNELIMLARHGDTTMQEALETIKDSSREPRAAVWSQVASILGSSRQLTDGDEECEATLKLLCLKLASKQLKELGWSYKHTEQSNTTHLRTTLIGLAIASEDRQILRQALDLYTDIKDPEQLPAETRSLIMGTAVKFGDSGIFEHLIKTYKASHNADYRSDITVALTSTRDPKQAKQLAQLMLDTKIVRPQDTIRWFIYLLRNRYTKEVAWDWLEVNWDWIMKTFGGSKSYDDFARYSASFFNTSTWLTRYTDFFEPKASDPTLKRAITIGKEEIKAKVSWRKRDEPAIKAWLKEFAEEIR